MSTDRLVLLRTSRVAAGTALILATFCAGCSPANGDERADTSQAQAALSAWLECVECSDGELEKLVPHTSLVGPVLVEILSHGPSPSQKARIEDRLRADWRSLAPSARVYGEREYVEVFSQNAAVQYQIRAIQAFARFAAPQYDRALLDAYENPRLRPEVLQEVRVALGQRHLAPPAPVR
jgi:hypothetical protein